ncbi:MAG: AMP-binding protein [Bacteroidota bacterium]
MTIDQHWSTIHPSFRLNGIAYTRKELIEVGYSLIKEGETHEVPIGDFLLDWLSEADTLVAQTSGSTGIPKKIRLQKAHMYNSARATAQFLRLSPGNTALLCLPCTYIAGKMMLVRAMVLGLHLDYMAPDSSPLAHLGKTFDFTALVPLQASNSIKQLAKIAKVIIGGAPVSSELQIKLNALNTNIYETYGMTETVSHIAMHRLNGKPLGIDPLGTRSFQLMPNVSIATDDRGCLVIDAPKVSKGKVVTNDIVNLLSENTFQLLGRYDNIINSGGIKLMPEQVEYKLANRIENRFFVSAIEDKNLGEKLVLVIEGKVDKTLLEQTLLGIKSLQNYERPRFFLNIDRFIETPNGKLLRNKTVAAARPL